MNKRTIKKIISLMTKAQTFRERAVDIDDQINELLNEAADAVEPTATVA